MYFNHRVLLVLVSSLIACGGDSPTPLDNGGQDMPVPPAGSVTVTIQDFSFAPPDRNREERLRRGESGTIIVNP